MTRALKSLFLAGTMLAVSLGSAAAQSKVSVAAISG
ncbi:BMP family ABC transporter substrate-binding protein, partial [Mesorhizobium sp. M1C.F.Ca.ET.195.01.1.1]